VLVHMGIDMDMDLYHVNVSLLVVVRHKLNLVVVRHKLNLVVVVCWLNEVLVD